MLKFDEQSNPINAVIAPNGDAKLTVFPVDEDLRARLLAYRDGANPEKQVLSNAKLGKQLGYSEAMVSRYFNRKLQEVGHLESSAADLLKGAETRKSISSTLFETSITVIEHATFEHVRKLNDFAGIVGAAGIGKTCGIDLYVLSNPTAVKVTVTSWNRSRAGIINAIAREVDMRGYSRLDAWAGKTKADHLVEKFKDSNRLIIFDNAQRLARGAREFIFDFHDATNSPICFVGNPEFFDAIKLNDQMFSRIGIRKTIRLSDERKLAVQMLGKLAPDHVAALEPLAEQVIKAEGGGHARALKKEILLALDLFESGKFDTVQQAFRAAHLQLFRDYKLT